MKRKIAFPLILEHYAEFRFKELCFVKLLHDAGTSIKLPFMLTKKTFYSIKRYWALSCKVVGFW